MRVAFVAARRPLALGARGIQPFSRLQVRSCSSSPSFSSSTAVMLGRLGPGFSGSRSSSLSSSLSLSPSRRHFSETARPHRAPLPPPPSPLTSSPLSSGHRLTTAPSPTSSSSTAPLSPMPSDGTVRVGPNGATTASMELPGGVHLTITHPSSDHSTTSSEDLVAFRDVTLDEILSAKHARLGGLATVHEDDMVFNAIGLMEKEGIGAVLVKNSDGQFTGIFSERDYMRKIALKGLSSRNTPVNKVMTPHPVIVPSSDTAIKVMQLMTSRRFRHVPVRHDATGEVVGIVSIGDIMATVLKEYKDSAKYMRDFVAGKYPA